ncbi:phenylacetate--CoA ligase family protein [Neptuniibacter sp. SY11_33]|uniref:phenylacetate--CoA ligase family protein n=1 Tax=Neptuniibacter sp. SY11_33 TaxID=3398215 RepID=UPI0039F4A01B
MLLDKIFPGAPGLRWPVIPKPDSALHLGLQFQLEKSQWLNPDEIEQLQWCQAEGLIYHAAKTVPLYKDRIPSKLIGKSLSWELWQEIPILSRKDLIEAGDRQKSLKPLPGHERLNKIQSSGSTGMAITAYGTQTTGLFWQAFTLRDHIWQERDLSGKLAAIRPVNMVEPGESSSSPNWGGVTAKLFATGPAVLMSSRSDIADQARWLEQENPDFLLSLPSNLRELAKYCREHNIALTKLKQVRTMGEILTADTIELSREVLGVEIVDMYSAQEVGYIALQCKEKGNYHIQSEGVLVEVLDDNNQQCRPGEVGRVVVTTLLNFGAPLIRYALGDYAEVGECCDCGRGLPVLNKVLGRQRNMVITPEGRCFFPSFPEKYWDPKIKQLQFQQIAEDAMNLCLVVSEVLTNEEEKALIECFNNRSGYNYKFTFEYRDEIPRSKGGKYEDFVSLLI